MPRNVGIQLARGKYIAFLDSDDLFTKTALEEFSTLAEKYQADVINTTEFFYFEDRTSTTEELLNTKNHQIISCRNAGASRLQRATVVSENIAERVQLWLNNDFHWSTWATFCRRDFFIVNRIDFCDMPLAEDIVMNFSCLCRAEKILRVPNINYIYRERKNSASHGNTNFEKSFRKWIKGLNSGFNELNKIMNHIAFFEEHADYRYAVLDWFFDKLIQQGWQITAAYEKIYAFSLNPLVEKEFHPDDAALSSYLFDRVNIQRLQIMELRAELQKFQQQ